MDYAKPFIRRRRLAGIRRWSVLEFDLSAGADRWSRDPGWKILELAGKAWGTVPWFP